ncbi:family 16 glycosylhydrolase [Marinoscillum pacificum]|uniref:family 16 glycosylhydrolase n=1 Tax=Marinoscillum pacificum TaxID=392723 RepID=UPI0021587775|nr:family 16 glycosylhydrolase [Marinoscillum pacificum]
MPAKVIISLSLILLFFACNDEGTTEVDPSVLTSNDVSISETETTRSVILDLFLSSPQNEQVIINYTTEDGTALKDEDYEAATGTILFEVGDMRESLSISLIGDEEFEETESFFVSLSAQSTNVVVDTDLIEITIQDNDEPPGNELIIPSSGYQSPTAYDGYQMVWQDEFDQEALNLNDWTYEIGNGYSGWGNNELEYYTDENTSMVDGNLVITAKKESRGGYNYTSSRIITKGKQEFKYGRVDIRAVLPYGQGIWPALWMLGANIDQVSWPKCGEIDIMELIGGGDGRDNVVHGTVHWDNNGSYANYGGSTKLSSGIFNDEYHVFSILWDESKIKWLLDGEQYHEIDITPAALSELRSDQFVIFNVAVGGNWPGSPNSSTTFPQFMIVDYIRVFEKQ